MEDSDFLHERQQALDALASLVVEDQRIEGLWLQGSLARGDADPLSDIDAYLSVTDASFDEVFRNRFALIGSIRPILTASDATTPGLRCVHALLESGTRIDLFFEAASEVAQQKRPAVRLVVDKADLATRLAPGWEAPTDTIGRIVAVIIRMTRQGGTWPLRVLRRGQWSTFAMMELDLINAQVAQLMAVQTDPANFYQNPFSLYRRLDAIQCGTLDTLTGDVLAGVANRDAGALLTVHLKILEALIREGRAACASLGVPYPIPDDGDERLRRLLVAGWPA